MGANRWEGDLKGLSDEDIELAADWEGEPGVFTAALRDVGFLDGDEGNSTVHDWAEHNPWATNRGRRIEAAKLAANKRWERQSDALPMQAASAPHESAMPTTQPNPTPPNPTRRKPKASAGADAPSLPDWIPTDCWAGFLEMRRNIRAPVTNHAIKLLIDRLLELRNDGHDLGAVLDQSTRNNWKDVYPLNGKDSNRNGNRAQQRQAANLAANEEAKRSFGLVD